MINAWKRLRLRVKALDEQALQIRGIEEENKRAPGSRKEAAGEECKEARSGKRRLKA